MFVVQNKTHYTADAVLLPDEHGIPRVVTVIKAAFSFSPEGLVTPHEKQAPLCYGDEYWGEPAASSLKYPSDMVAGKKGTDIAVNGHVYAPNGEKAAKVHAAVSVGTLKKTVAVWGDRSYASRLRISGKTTPQPFSKLPIRYERSFGGSHPLSGSVFRENPVGTGFGPDRRKGDLLPNFEHFPGKGRKTAIPAGFGFIAPSWEPRASLLGTWDDNWRKHRMPLPPEDFDPRFNNAANPFLITEKPLTGKENVILTNLHRSSETVRFRLPGLVLKAAYIFRHETEKLTAVPDTLVIEPDENRFILVYRTTCTGPHPWSRLIQVTIHEEIKTS